VAGLRGVTISDVFTDDFPSRLAKADVLVLAYNFDEDSLRYIGLSMPNKLPEYLASGAAMLAIGPREANGIDYVLSHDLACCVTEQDPEKLSKAIRRLGTDPDHRNELAENAQAWASEHLDLARISTRFQTILREAAARPAKRPPVLSHEMASPIGAGTPTGDGSEGEYDAGTVTPTGLSRYERFYEWAKARNPAVLFMGRLGAWCGRKVRGYPALAAAYVALLVGLVVAGFLPGLTAYAPLFWVAAGALATAGVVGVVLGFARFLIKEAQHELDKQQVNLRRRLEGLETSLGAKVDQLLSAEKSTRDALLAEIDQLNRDQKAGNDALQELIDDRLEAGQKQMLRHVSLRFARLQAHSADFDGVVLLMTPERSGSTWFLDLLRCHPAALLLPAVDIFRELGVRGRRYPLHLSDSFGETLDIEAEEGVGAGIPAFTLRDVGTRPGSRLAVEKIHPSAIRFDVPGFLSRIDEMEDATHKQIRCCYLTRDPVDSIRSFVAYKRREPGWGIDAPISSAPDLYLRSFEALVELISKRPGPVVRYEHLAADPIQTVASVYQWLWPEIGRSTNASIASEAVELTRRDRVENAQTGRFLGQADDATPTTTSLLLGSDDELRDGSHRVIQECRRLSATVAELGLELPSASDE
jgi:hypothetical protein